MAKKKLGRPRLPESERRKNVGINLSPDGIDALRELSDIRDMPQGPMVEEMLLRDLARERRKHGK